MRVTIEISDEDAGLIRQLLDRIGDTEFNTHGRLDIETVAAMLLEDVALAQRRPGSWEGHNMLHIVLAAHGYSE